MKTSFKILLAAGSILCSAAALSATTTSAMAQPASFSFRVGNIAMGYTDGYYDHDRRWHSWRNARERNWYRSNYNRYNVTYRSMRHDRDHDGIADRFDRDRDNDGVANNRDRAPNNPYRR